MKWLLLSLIFISTPTLAVTINDRTIKIGVVDTGLDLTDPRFSDQLCPTGHRDFTNEGIQDTNSHGTHIAGLIKRYAGKGNYCFLIYKYYSDKLSGHDMLINEVRAFKEAIKNGAQIINFSSNGQGFNEEEYLVIKTHPEITFVVAAGNEGKDLDAENTYPAAFHFVNEEIVGNLDRSGQRLYSSNWSDKTMFWEMGTQVFSTLPNNNMGYKTGTSQATAIHTGKMIRNLLDAAK